MAPSSNIIPLNTAAKSPDPALSLNSAFITILEKHLSPATPPAIEEMLNVLLEKSKLAENNNQASELMDAYSLLKNNQKKLTKHFFKLLKSPSRNESQKTQPDKLSLMDNHEFDRRLISQISSQALIIDEATPVLISISKRLPKAKICTQLISPENICTSFEQSLSHIIPLSIEIEDILLHTFSHSLRQPALVMWEEIDQLLESEGFTKQETPINTRQENNQNEPDHSVTPETLLLENITSNVLSKVEHLISEKTNNSVMSTSATDTKTLAPSDLAVQLSIIQTDLLDKLNSIEDLTGSIKQALDDQGVNHKLSNRHKDLINLVGMLFEFILDDHQLDNNVSKLIGLLQIPILKLALIDESFLNERHHPARDLLNEMTSAGMKCNEHTSADDPILALIEKTVRTIISNADENDIFTQSLDNFLQELDAICQQAPEDSPAEIDNEENTPTNSDHQDSEHAAQSEKKIKIKPEPINNHPIEDTENIEEIILQSDSLSNSTAFKESCKAQHNEIDFKPIEGLFIGQWVEFIGSSEKSLRCQLSNIDHIHDSYVFTNSSGMKVTEKSGNTLKKELKNGSMKILTDMPLFDRTLQRVMNKLRRP